MFKFEKVFDFDYGDLSIFEDVCFIKKMLFFVKIGFILIKKL